MSEQPELLDDQNTAWVQRLWQRSERPGVVRLARAQATAVRLTQWGTPPLADEVSRRYAAVMAMQQQLPPIVYAELHPVLPNRDAAAAAATAGPLPIVTSKPASATAVAHKMTHSANSLQTPANGARPSVPVVRSVTTVPMANDSSPPKLAANSPAVPPPMTPPAATSSLSLPVVAPTSPPSIPALSAPASVSQATPMKKDTAVSPAKTPAPVVSAWERPSATPTTSLSTMPPTTPLSPLPAGVQFRSTPVGSTQSETQQPGNGRAPTIPVAQAQPATAELPIMPPLPQPLPLAQPMGGVIQRMAQEKDHKETAVNRASSSPQPAPAPNRVVRAYPVVQRASGNTDMAVSTGSQQENESSPETTPTLSNMDMDELVEKVHRRFLRRLAVEGERRGKTVWP